MKVIVAGLSKTGTKSMVVALQELGMNVYDYMEHFDYFASDWIKLMHKGGNIEDFRRMYQEADAVTDLPAGYFWEELHKAFPEAKIILSTRDNEDVWCESLINQAKNFYSPALIFMSIFSSTYRKFWKYANAISMAIYKSPEGSSLKMSPINHQSLKKVYRMHNTYVMQRAPKDKLLVFNVKEGWEPLCKFLGVDVPSKPFPHKNVRGSILKELAETHPTFIQMKREVLLSFSLVAAGLSLGCYKLIKSLSLC